jgi:uncharacterized protein with von Willebrand factor type A (vWA) domain
MVDWFLRQSGGERKKIDDQSRMSIKHDRYDLEELQAIREQMEGYDKSVEKLEKVAPDTGVSLHNDDFLALLRTYPRQVPPDEMRASHVVNHSVMKQILDHPEYEKLHEYTAADSIGSAMAAIQMEPILEQVLDKLSAAQKQADELHQQMQDYESLDNAMQELLAAGGDPDAIADLRAQLEQAAQGLQESADLIDQQLQHQASGIAQAMGEAMSSARSDAEAQESMSSMWGLSPGELKRLPADQRLELARRMDNPKLRKVAELFGAMVHLALAEQRNKIIARPEETYDIETGRDLTRVLPSELATMNYPGLSTVFWKKYIGHELLQYKRRGNEKIAKGPIIYIHDGSGSMANAPEMWAKSVGLALYRVAIAQKRKYRALQFGSEFELVEFEFRDKEVSWWTGSKDAPLYRQTTDLPQGITDFAEFFFGGGTSFQPSLTRALEIMREEYDKTGAVQSDIVFATDGHAKVDNQWLKAFKAEQQALGFRVWGIAIGASISAEPLLTICDNRVFTIRDLITGGDIRAIFQGV